MEDDLVSTTVVSKVASLLRVFTQMEPDLSLAQVSERARLPKPTAHRLLHALAREGFIYQDPISRRYSLGLGLVRVAATVLHRDDLSARAAASLAELQDICGESVSLQLLVGNERLCVREVVSRHDLRIASGLGRVRPLYAGAAGKVILAFLGEQEREQVLATLPPERGEAWAVHLRRELVAVRAAGYATSHAENTPGATAIAAPVFDAQRVVGAVNISGPEARWTDQAMLGCLEPLLRAVRAVSTIASLPHAMEALA